MRSWSKYGFFAVIAGVVVLLDQISKAMVLKYMDLHHSISVIPGVFSLTHIHNRGGAFGFFAQNDSILRHWLFLSAAVIAMGLILYFYYQTPRTHRWLAAALALIFGGAVGNVLDRVRMGRVVDFLDVYVGAYHWPTFNMADSAVSIGVAIFVFHLLFRKMPY